MKINITGISDLVLSNYNFISYRQEEYKGLRLPICVLTVLGNRHTIEGIVLDSLIKVEIESEEGVLNSLEFYLKDYTHAPYMDNLNSVISFYMIYKYEEYVNTKKQSSEKGALIDVLTKAQGNLPLTILYPEVITKDKCEQVWVRPNTSLKAFLRSMVSHLYIAEDNAVLSSITIKEGLSLAPLKELLDEKTKPDYFLGRHGIEAKNYNKETDPEYLYYEVVQFETDHGLGDHVLGKSKVLTVLNSVTNDTTILDFKGSEVSVDSTGDSAYLSGAVINNGNCHLNYYKAEARNRTAWVAFDAESILVRIITDQLRFDIPILSTVDILASETDEMYLPYKGRHIITEKYIGFQAEGGYNYLLLQRPPVDYFKKV